MPNQPRLIVQVASGSPVDRQLSAQPPVSVANGEVVVDPMLADDEGKLMAPAAGEVVLSLPSPEALARQADDVRTVIERAGKGVEPLVVLVEAAEELRQDELAVVIEAAEHTSRPVILRVIRDA